MQNRIKYYFAILTLMSIFLIELSKLAPQGKEIYKFTSHVVEGIRAIEPLGISKNFYCRFHNCWTYGECSIPSPKPCELKLIKTYLPGAESGGLFYSLVFIAPYGTAPEVISMGWVAIVPAIISLLVGASIMLDCIGGKSEFFDSGPFGWLIFILLIPIVAGVVMFVVNLVLVVILKIVGSIAVFLFSVACCIAAFEKIVGKADWIGTLYGLKDLKPPPKTKG